MSSGRFITLEGIEGAGKSTCVEHVRAELFRQGIKPVLSREPGGTELGETLREVLLSNKHNGMSDDAELLLMFAARAEHLEAVIRPALSGGTWVLCDRFTDASFAYQGGGRGIADQRIETLADWVQRGQQPDLTLLLDLPVEVGLYRAGKRSAPDRIEQEQADFFQRVREKYLEIAKREPGRVKVIDASLELSQVLAQITAVIDTFIHTHD